MDLQEIREQAEHWDKELTRLLALRADYPANLDFYQKRENFGNDSCLHEYASRFYSGVLSAICSDFQNPVRRELVNGVFDIDKKIMFLLIQRTGVIGQEVARYKHPRGMPTYVPEVEAKKLEARAQEAIHFAANPDKIKAAFQLIFDETKRIEEYVAETEQLNATGGIRSIRTCDSGLVEKLKQGLLFEAARIPGKHSVGVHKQEQQGSIPVYTITLY